jgi:excisionase family DNA binding protein
MAGTKIEPRRPQMPTMKQVEHRLGVGWVRVRELINSGDLPAYRMTPRGHFSVRETDVEKFIESRRYVPKDAP